MEVQTTGTEVRIVKTALEELALFFSTTSVLVREYEQELREFPGNQRRIERNVIHAFKKGAGMLNTTSTDTNVMAQVTEIQQSSDTPLRSPIRQTVFIRLLCGILLQVTTLYCAPKSNKSKPADNTEAQSGLYPELAVYGFAKKSSAAFEEYVARRVALSPSLELATRELNDEGIDINVKEVRRIALQCGETLLAIRLTYLQSFLAGTMTPGNELAGKRVVVEVDGGRMKLRKNKAQKRKGTGKHPKYHTDWREPKLLIIYTVDEHGKKEKQSRVWMDGTFQGPDHTAELLASWLYRLGINQAESITFIADGATWIWDRFDWIVNVLELPKVKVQYVLDFYHAAHHISLALGELSLTDDERRGVYKELRSELRNSRWQVVVDRLKELGSPFHFEEESVFCRELRFIVKHGKSGHLNYTTYSRRGLPLGSGAVESAIRRVVNLRLKGNGMFWTQANAESMLQLRCQILGTQWEECLDELYKHRLKTRRRKWEWQAIDRSRKSQIEPKPTVKNHKSP